MNQYRICFVWTDSGPERSGRDCRLSSQRDLANGINVPYQRINELVNKRRGITPSTALRLAKFFGKTPDFWMNLQQRWDLYHAQANEAKALGTIRKLSRMKGIFDSNALDKLP